MFYSNKMLICFDNTNALLFDNTNKVNRKVQGVLQSEAAATPDSKGKKKKETN